MGFGLRNLVAGNIGPVVMNTIPGIGTGNPGSASSGYVENWVWMILPQGTSLRSILEGSWNANARSYLMRGNCGRRLSRGNSASILTAGRSGWWIDRNCRTVFDLISVLDLEFWPQMTGWQDFWVGKERWDMDRRCRRLFIDNLIRAS